MATKKLNVSPNYCWAVEDSLSGVKSALAAGCHVWLLENLKKDMTEKNTRIEMINVNKITSLIELLDELKSQKDTNRGD